MKPRAPLAAGERVRVYQPEGPVSGKVLTFDKVSVLVEVSDGVVSAHPKQCRRLRKKSPVSEKDSIWLVPHKGLGGTKSAFFENYNEACAFAASLSPAFAPVWEYTALKPGSVIVDGAKVREYWNDEIDGSGTSFQRFCKLLGIRRSE